MRRHTLFESLLAVMIVLTGLVGVAVAVYMIWAIIGTPAALAASAIAAAWAAYRWAA